MRRVYPIALCVVVWSGCIQMAPVDRGTLIPLDQLRAHRRDLDGLAIRELRAGHPARAFYALEHRKSRRFAAIGPGGNKRDDAPADVERTLETEAAGGAGGDDGSTRGLGDVRVDTGEDMPRSAARADERYWRAQRVTEARARKVAERKLPFRIALAERFVVATAEEAQRMVAPDQVLLQYLVTERAAYGIAVRRSGLHAHRLSATPGAVVELAVRLRRAVRDPDRAWRPVARRAHRILLGPFADAMADVRTVTVVPDGVLSNVPFAALVGEDGRVLLRRALVGYLPSASFYRYVMERQLLEEPPRALVVGGADYPDPWPALPNARLEGRTVSRMFQESLLLTGAQATEERVRASYRDYNVYHFATHGMLSGRLGGRASSLVLARPPDGRGYYLTAAEIARLDLSHSYLAVLSACETSTSTGADLDSISASFLTAGTPSVVGSLWRVDDESTAALMVQLYSHFMHVGAAEALRRAQLALADSARWSDPAHWGAFVLYGWDK